MKKRIKQDSQTAILQLINEDKDRPVDMKFGFNEIFENVDVSEYQKKRYFVLFSNFYYPLLFNVQNPHGGISPFKIIPQKAVITREITPYIKRIDPLTLARMGKAFEEIHIQYFTFIAQYGSEEDVLNAIHIHQKGLKYSDLVNMTLGYPGVSDSDIDNWKKWIRIFEDRLNELEKNKGDSDPLGNVESFERRKNVIFRQANNFNRLMSLQQVFNHFSVLVSSKNKKGEPFLTKDDLLTFIERAFIGKQVPKVTLNVNLGEHGKIISFFHHFYAYSIYADLEYPARCMEKYKDLLVSNFTNYTETQINHNFGRPSKKILESPLKIKQKR